MGEHTETIKALNARRAGMDAEYQHSEPLFREIRNTMDPNNGRFHIGEKRRSTGYNKKIIDSKAKSAHRTLVSGLMGGVTSPSRPWFIVSLFDRSIADEYEVKQWLHEVQTRMYDIIKASNTYRMFNQCYSSLGMYGVFGGLMVGSFENVIHTHSLPIGSYRLAEDGESHMNALHYSCTKTVAQLVKKFGKENVSNEVYRDFKANNMNTPHLINHAVEQRYDRDPMSKLATDMPFASYYWEDSKTDKLLQESGFGVNNILAPRWDQVDNEVWPTEWPALLALGDATQLQVQHRDKAMAIQYSYKPPMNAPAGYKKRFRNVPGAMNTMSTTDLQRGGIRPAIEVRPDVGALMQDINETRDRISNAFFEDLFLMTSQSDRRQVTATEIAERHEEKLIVLGPVLESLDYELLSKVIEAVFHYMLEADIVPPAPDVMVGKPLKVEYVSLLAQAQKAVGVAAIERTLGFAGSLAQISADVLDNIDSDAMLKEFADQVGPPPNILLPSDKVQEIRQARAQKEQQQQMMEQAEPMANAAKLISEASARGAEGLQRGAPL